MILDFMVEEKWEGVNDYRNKETYDEEKGEGSMISGIVRQTSQNDWLTTIHKKVDVLYEQPLSELQTT